LPTGAGVKLSKKLALQHFAQSASWHGVEHGRPWTTGQPGQGQVHLKPEDMGLYSG
jgi:hypothetical protein